VKKKSNNSKLSIPSQFIHQNLNGAYSSFGSWGQALLPNSQEGYPNFRKADICGERNGFNEGP